MSKLSQFVDYCRNTSANAASWVNRKLSAPLPDYQQPKKKGTEGEAVFARLLGGFGSSGVQYPGYWTSNRIEQVQHYQNFVYEAIRKTMELCTKEPPNVVKVRPKNDAIEHKMLIKSWQQGNISRPQDKHFLTQKDFGTLRKMQDMVREHEVFENVEEEHELKKLLARPNTWDTGAELFQERIMYLELTGNAYIWPVPYTNHPGIAELWVIPSHWMQPVRTNKTNRLVDYYQCIPIGTYTAAIPFCFDADEIIHYRYKSPLSKIDGQSPLQAGATLVDSFEKTNLARFFSMINGANIGAMIELPSETDPRPETVERFIAQLKSKYQGIQHFEEPGILPPGATIDRPDGAIELAYQQSQDQLRDYVLSLWGYSRSIMGFQEDVNRASFEAGLVQAYYMVINPRLSLLDTIDTERLASKYGKDIRIFHKDQTPQDRQLELKEWTEHFKSAQYTSDEYRQWRNMEPLPGGDEVIDPIKMAIEKEELKRSRGSVEEEQLAGSLDPEGKQEQTSSRIKDRGNIGSGFKSGEQKSLKRYKTWVVDKSNNPCEECLALDGQTVEVGEDFIDGAGNVVKIGKIHEHCRCEQTESWE